jgi:prepilin-type N-terminal cleavage/methylation domain-containing protein
LKAKFRKGFTLVELVVALAIFIVIITISFSVLSRFFAMRSAYEQEMILQQNFRFAVDRITHDMRAAVEGNNKIIQAPADNSIGESLQFYTSDGKLVEYKLSDIEPYKITRQVGTASPEPVTEEMHQLVKLYFVSDSKKIVVIIVGKTKYGGKENTLSFTSLVYTRNTGYPSSP